MHLSPLFLPCHISPQLTGGSDPYVVATLGDSAATTDVLWGQLEPAWHETHTLYVRDASRDAVRLRVIDKNKLASDVELGLAVLPLQTLLDAPGRRVTVPLQGARALDTLGADEIM